MKKLLLLLFFPLLLAANEEANRFFEEFQLLRDTHPEQAKKHLQTALVLSPMDQKIRIAELEFYSRFIFECAQYADHLWSWRISEWQRQVRRIEQFRRDFPDLKKLNHPWSKLLMWKSPNHCIPITSDERSKMKELCDFYRNELRKELLAAYKHDLSKTILNEKELDHAFEFYSRFFIYQNYFDFVKWTTKRLEYATQLMKAFEEYAIRHPEKIKQLNRILQLETRAGCNGDLCNIFHTNNPDLTPEAVHTYLQSTQEFSRLAAKSDFFYFQRQKRSLELMHKCLDSQPNAENAEKLFMEYFSDLENLLPKKQSIDYSVFWFNYFAEFTAFWLKDAQIAHQTFQTYLQKTNKTDKLNTVIKMLREDNWPKIIANADLIRSLNINRLRGNNLEHDFFALSPKFFNDPINFSSSSVQKRNPTAEKAFFILNRDFEIATETYQELFKHKETLFLVATASTNGRQHMLLRTKTIENEYLLAESGNGPTLWHGEISSDGKTVKLMPTPIPLWYGGQMRVNTMAVDEKNLTVFTTNRQIYIYDMAFGKWKLIREIPEMTVYDSFLLEGRLYLLQEQLVGINSKRMIFSMKVDGTDWKIHVSSERFEPKNELDKGAGKIAKAVIRRGEVYLVNAIDKQCSMLYRYNPQSGDLKLIAELPFFVDSMCQDNDDLIMESGINLYRFDLESCKAKLIFCRFSNPQVPSLKASGASPYLRFVVNGKFLWLYGQYNTVIDITNPERTPMLLLPWTLAISVNADNTVCYFTNFRRFKISLKPNVDSGK